MILVRSDSGQAHDRQPRGSVTINERFLFAVIVPFQTVAKLTADNLVFLMNLKKTEAELAAANQEKLQLRLAAEKQRGPWFDEVGNGVFLWLIDSLVR